MIFVEQFEKGNQGLNLQRGVLNAKPKQRETYTSLHRGCASQVRAKQIIYTYTHDKKEYVLAQRNDGNFELSLTSDDKLPPGLKKVCSACGSITSKNKE